MNDNGYHSTALNAFIWMWIKCQMRPSFRFVNSCTGINPINPRPDFKMYGSVMMYKDFSV